MKDKWYSQNEVIKHLALPDTDCTRRKLTILRIGMHQTQNKPNGRFYVYYWKSKLTLKLHWCYINGRVYYNNSGVQELRNILADNGKIYFK